MCSLIMFLCAVDVDQCSSPRLDSVSDENAAFNTSPNPRRSICMPRGHGTYEMQWVVDCW